MNVLLLSTRQSDTSVSDSSPLDLSDWSFCVLFLKYTIIWERGALDSLEET